MTDEESPITSSQSTSPSPRKVRVKALELGIMTLVLLALLVLPSISFLSVKKPFVIVLAVVGLILSVLGLFNWRRVGARKSWVYGLADFVFTFQVMLTVIILFFSWVLFPMQVVQTSMYPTLYEGERILASPARNVERGDIVIAKLSTEQAALLGEKDTYVIKRVIGLAGDVIVYEAEGLFVNGEQITEDYIFNGVLGSHWSGTVPEGCCFLMGDNRAVSADSRVLGCFSSSQLIGIARYTFGFLYVRKVEA